MNLEFSIASWAAFAPGLSSQGDWLAWAAQPWLPTGNEQPALADMPPMARRRLGPIGKAAIQAAYWCQGTQPSTPVVLASRYGDAERSLELLGSLARDEALSPTAFGLSVHNAIGAQYSIARGDHANYLSISAGASSAGAAVVEAVSLLHDGAAEVMVVCYDAPLLGDYASFSEEASCRYAWAWRVTRPLNGSGACFELSTGAAAPNATAPPLPFGLDLLRFVLSPDAAWQHHAEGRTWRGRRRG